MSGPVTYRLSSLDQSKARSYIRVCYCFPRKVTGPKTEDVVLALESSTQHAIEHFPILAGSVVAEQLAPPSDLPNTGQTSHRRDTVGVRQPHPLFTQARRESTGGNTFALLRIRDEVDPDDTRTGQRGCLKVLVVPGSHSVKPVVKYFKSGEFPRAYDELSTKGLPQSALLGHAFTPLPDMPDPAQGSNPVFAVQANFIDGGVIVAIFLHHAVADVFDMANIVQRMSSGKGVPTSSLSVPSDAIEQSRSRDRLSGSRGVKASTLQQFEQNRRPNTESSLSDVLRPANGGSVRVLAFDLDKIKATAKMANDRTILIREVPYPNTTPLECLIAILWKSFARARRHGVATGKDQVSELRFPVNMRMRLDPPLGKEYFGNAWMSAKATSHLPHLSLPFDVGTLSRAAHAVHNSSAATSETELRATIAAVHESSDVRSALDAPYHANTDLLITDWSELPIGEDARLGLGLGPAAFVREVGRGSCKHGFLILPKKRKERHWEVVAQFDEETVARLLEDVGLQPFLLHVA